MSLEESYKLLSKDLSGTISKNRFRNELLWGMHKLYQTYTEDDRDFFLIFDYVCDIELGFDDELHFYQVKTKSINKGKFTINELINIKGKSKHSILSNLIKNNVSDKVMGMSIVANKNLSCENKTLSNTEVFCLDTLEDDEKETIKKHIKDTIGIDIELDKVYFVLSKIPLLDSNNALLGETVKFLQQVSVNSVKNSTHFFEFLKGIIEEKATYELETITLSDTILKKGITREQLKEIIDKYNATSDDYASRISIIIDSIKQDLPYLKYLDIKKSLTKFSQLGLESNLVRTNVSCVLKTISEDNSYSSMSLFELIKNVVQNLEFQDLIDDADKMCIVCIALSELEGGENQ